MTKRNIEELASSLQSMRFVKRRGGVKRKIEPGQPGRRTFDIISSSENIP